MQIAKSWQRSAQKSSPVRSTMPPDRGSEVSVTKQVPAPSGMAGWWMGQTFILPGRWQGAESSRGGGRGCSLSPSPRCRGPALCHGSLFVPLSLRLQGGAFASEKRGTGEGRGKEDMCVRTLEKSGGAPSFKLGQTLQPHDAKYETGKQEEERWCVTAWQLSTGKPRWNSRLFFSPQSLQTLWNTNETSRPPQSCRIPLVTPAKKRKCSLFLFFPLANNSGMIWKATGIQRTQQVRAFYPHRFWTQVQDLVNINVYWWTKSKFSHFLTTCQQKTMAGTLLFPPAWSREQLPGKLRLSSPRFICKERAPPPTSSCSLADYRPESQHY